MGAVVSIEAGGFAIDRELYNTLKIKNRSSETIDLQIISQMARSEHNDVRILPGEEREYGLRAISRNQSHLQ